MCVFISSTKQKQKQKLIHLVDRFHRHFVFFWQVEHSLYILYMSILLIMKIKWNEKCLKITICIQQQNKNIYNRINVNHVIWLFCFGYIFNKNETKNMCKNMIWIFKEIHKQNELHSGQFEIIFRIFFYGFQTNILLKRIKIWLKMANISIKFQETPWWWWWLQKILIISSFGWHLSFFVNF